MTWPTTIVQNYLQGEGSKPIFEREEIKRTALVAKEIEEHRTVVTVNNEILENKSKPFKRRSVSLNLVRSQSHSPRRTLSRHFRYKDSKHDDRGNCRSDREVDRNKGKSKAYKEKDRRHSQSYNVENEHPWKKRSRRDHSRSREREQRKLNREFHDRDEKSYREYRERSRERSRERRNKDRSKERKVPAQHSIDHIPVLIYYGNFPLRPLMVAPLLPIREQGPLGSNRHPSMMGPIRPFGPRFIPANMFSLRPPPNPRFGPMF